MNADHFAEWMRRRKRLVLRTESSYWHSEGLRALQAFPYDWTIHPGEHELTRLLKESRAVTLRYSTSTDAPLGYLSYHVVRENRSSYEIDDLGKWARKNVRRGLRSCSIEPLSFHRLAEEGWNLQLDTLERQGRKAIFTREDWIALCLSASDLPGFEAWGALIHGRLAASVITFLMDDCCYLLYQQCHREYLTAHVNNALGFSVTQMMLRRDGVHSVFYSLHSLDARSSVDEFKFRLGFVAKPVRQRVVFHPLCSPLVNSLSHGVLRAAKILNPKSSLIAKTEGIVRFYVQGKKPLSRQAGAIPALSLSGVARSPYEDS